LSRIINYGQVSIDGHHQGIINTSNCQTALVESLTVIMNAKLFQYDQNIAAYVLLKSDKVFLLKTNKTCDIQA
jgi:hypothetical protein